MKYITKNIKLIVGILIGLVISVPVAYAAGNILFQSSQVSFDNTRANLTKTNGDPVETVEEAVEALARTATPTCSNSPFHLGDYIDMTPSTTTSTTIATLSGVTGSVTPSELNLWRVIKINSDCTVEVVSEYVTSTDITLNGKDGYKNMVYGLNEYAKLYANTTYTLDPSTAPDGAFRNVGYDGQTKQITDTTRLDDQTLGTASGAWYEKTTAINGEESLGGGDQGFGTDVKLLDDAGISLVAYEYNTTTPTAYWLASRLFYWYSTSRWDFGARYMEDDGSVYNGYLWSRGGSSFGANTDYYAVRPIVTLKSGLTTASGTGTSASHYTLSVS